MSNPLVFVTVKNGHRLQLKPNIADEAAFETYTQLTLGTLYEWRAYGGDQRFIVRLIVSKLKDAGFRPHISPEARKLLYDQEFAALVMMPLAKTKPRERT
jgi:hypothetical protein